MWPKISLDYFRYFFINTNSNWDISDRGVLGGMAPSREANNTHLDFNHFSGMTNLKPLCLPALEYALQECHLTNSARSIQLVKHKDCKALTYVHNAANVLTSWSKTKPFNLSWSPKTGTCFINTSSCRGPSLGHEVSPQIFYRCGSPRRLVVSSSEGQKCSKDKERNHNFQLVLTNNSTSFDLNKNTLVSISFSEGVTSCVPLTILNEQTL